jgi:hypothetical protein
MEKKTRKMSGYGKKNIQEEKGYERGMVQEDRGTLVTPL